MARGASLYSTAVICRKNARNNDGIEVIRKGGDS